MITIPQTTLDRSPATLEFLDAPEIDYDDWIGDDLYVEPVDVDVPDDTDFFSVRCFTPLAFA